MGIFQKTVEVEEVSAASPKGSKANELYKFVSESVTETALNIFREVKAFTVPRYGGPVYVGLILDTADIGGIDKKSKKDQEKGQILECIKNDQLQVYAPTSLLNEGKFMLIPTETTLSNMDEYPLLKQAPYTLGEVDDDGFVKSTDVKVSYLDVVQIFTGETSLGAFLGTEETPHPAVDNDDDEIIVEDDEEETSVDISSGQPMYDPPEAVEDYSDDSLPFDSEEDDDENLFTDEPAVTSDDDELDELEDDDEIDFSEDDTEDYLPDDEVVEPEQPVIQTEEESSADTEPQENFDDEQVKESIVRRFYASDLGLEVSLAPFDAQFLMENPVPAFAEIRGDQWLDGYLSQMAQDANQELLQMHEGHLFRLREQYFALMSEYCDTIFKRLDTSDRSTQYGKLLQGLEEQRARMEEDAQEQIAQKKSVITEDWQRRLDKYVEAASMSARRQFEDRYSRQHEDALAQIEPAVYDEIEAGYQQAKKEIHDQRRAEAARLLDYGITETLAELSKKYAEYLEAEKELFLQRQQEMRQFLDDNRKDEIARVKVLAEQKDSEAKVEQAISEYTKRMEAQSAEFEASQQRRVAEIERIREDNERELKRQQTGYEERLSYERKHNQDLSDQLAALTKERDEREAQIRQEYEDRVQKLEEERAGWSKEADRINEVHKKNHTASIFLMIAAVIAAIAIGILVGQFLRSSYTKQYDNTQITEMFQERLNDLEQEYGISAKD